ncbi:MAG TPA: glucoamylase family protein, partial [Saprospiraceae bacterium]|nr:glucoamylase family protein [Saprospiraceae bacterium]
MLFPYPPRLLRVLCVLCAKLFLIIPFLFLFFSNGICQNLFLTGKAYEKHSEINWNAFAGADRYEVYRQAPGEDHFSLVTTTHQLDWLDWNGNTTDHQAYSFYVNALNIVGSSLQRSDTITLDEHFMSDDEFLNMTQEYTFRYFYDYSHPTSGMARERLNSDDIVTTGGTGFGIMALLVGVHRGFITREEGVSRLIKIISFLQVADRFHGAFPHWMNGKTGHVIPFSTFDNGGDLVETAFLMEGLLCARAFFDQDDPEENTIRVAITGLWEDVEWDFYSRDDSGVLYWHWSPDYEWQMNFPIRGYNEALIVYLLAIASPTHPVDAQYYHTGWAGSGYINGNSWYGYKLYVGP